MDSNALVPSKDRPDSYPRSPRAQPATGLTPMAGGLGEEGGPKPPAGESRDAALGPGPRGRPPTRTDSRLTFCIKLATKITSTCRFFAETPSMRPKHPEFHLVI